MSTSKPVTSVAKLDPNPDTAKSSVKSGNVRANQNSKPNPNSTATYDAKTVIAKLPQLPVYYTKHIAAAFGGMNTKTLRRQMRARNIRVGSGNRHEMKLAECKRTITKLCRPVTKS